MGRIRLNGRIERTSADFAHIASLVAKDVDDDDEFTGSMTRALNQVSVSLPGFTDKLNFNLVFTDLKIADSTHSRVLSGTWNRPFGKTHVSATAYGDLVDDTIGGYLNVSFRLGEHRLLASSSLEVESDGVSVVQILTHPARDEVGETVWSLQFRESDNPQMRASGSTKISVAKFTDTYRQSADVAWATAKVSESVVAAAGGIFFGNRITDAFAIVDAGAPGVKVTRENRTVSRTGANGKALVEGLRSYENNRIGIDTSNLPLDVNVEKTKITVVPADRSGVMARFTAPEEGGAVPWSPSSTQRASPCPWGPPVRLDSRRSSSAMTAMPTFPVSASTTLPI
ncbi:fimbria/pilus outer membrane usher protein [Breoghania sp.]|uniref:fimbria/pilus outer membrane usher protein n=1 Tax=Breoghania sp. TaxID=2065378 RepID=UPI002605E043|nr:fimbria/pilus outer membrane usher protein [Breoghania sp.]MDJ0932316.1 fimbria/pilus outer membrane usher protein [Breoghania sp.]